MPDQLSICAFLRSESLAQSLQQFLSSDLYVLTHLESEEDLLHLTENKRSLFDCLIVEDDPALLSVVKHLYKQGILFPVVILKADANSFFYHPSGIELNVTNSSQISSAIDQAITQFLHLKTAGNTDSATHNLLLLQQQQLAEKLPEPFCLLDGWHKRNNQYFFQQMSSEKKQIFIAQIKSDYSQILLSYFAADRTLKQRIDNFINTAFYTDIPVPQIIEIHMELIEEFSKQLKLEGRSDEMLLDYRLTLIDILAHLCEMYRCSIPKQF